MSKKNTLNKILALGATSAALLGGAFLSSNDVQAASDSVTLLTVKHNAYKYSKSGKRLSNRVILKGSTYYSKGSYKIHGKKYHKLETKGNVFVKDGNLKIRVITEQVTLKHNAYTYNIHGKRLGKTLLRKGNSYFVYRTKYIRGKKFYQVGGSAYIKASNCGKPFSNVESNNNVDRTSTSTSTNTNSNTNTVNTNQTTNTNVDNAIRNSAVQNNNTSSSTVSNTHSGSNTQINVGGNTNNNKPASKPSTSTNKPANNQSTNKPSQGGNNTQINVGGNTNKPQAGNTGNTQKPSQPSSNPASHRLNTIVFPKGYIQAVKDSNFGVTPLTNKLSIEGNQINRFYSESSADDNMKIDSDNLTPAQAQEINEFALRLINQARSEYGTKPWVWSPVAQKVADRVAYLYEQDNMGLSTWHDQKALNQVDHESGITTSELMGGNPATYHEDYLTTMTDLKRAVYDDIASMLFSTVELHHAEGIFTWNSKQFANTHCAMSVSWVKKNEQGLPEHSEHFIIY